MAARTRKIRHDDETRAKIQAGNLINRLMKCFNGEIELTQTQFSCGKTLLAKVLPDLASHEHRAEGGVFVIPSPNETAEEWERENTPQRLQ